MDFYKFDRLMEFYLENYHNYIVSWERTDLEKGELKKLTKKVKETKVFETLTVNLLHHNSYMNITRVFLSLTYLNHLIEKVQRLSTN